MEQAIQTIRSLRSSFRVSARTETEVVMHVDMAEHGGVIGPCVIRFESPIHSWADEWVPESSKWKERPDLVVPAEGQIDEAHIKPVGSRFKLSFAAHRVPLVRWGFTTKSVTVCSAA